MAGSVGMVTDRGRLARELTRAVRGMVRFDDGARAVYASDASIYRQVPLGVVAPVDADDVLAALAVCRRFGAPVFARGGGTGLAGQSVNDGVALDFSQHMNRIVELDADRRLARVQPGVLCDQLRTAAGEHGLTFPVDPATHDRCTLGGMIGNNSCGTHSVYGGKTVDNVVELDVVTYDGTRMSVGATDEAEYAAIVAAGGRRGEIHAALRGLIDEYGQLVADRYPDIPRRVSGYNLDDLLPGRGFHVARALVGSESTCVLVLAATVRLLADPPQRALLVVGYPDVGSAADHVADFVDEDPIGLEFFDAGVVNNIARHGGHSAGVHELPEGRAWTLVEFGGADRDEVEAAAERVRARVAAPGVPTVVTDTAHQGDIWEVRRSAIEYSRIPGEHAGLAGWEDAAVDPRRLGGYVRDYCELVSRHGYHTVVFGHFGQGCMHNRLDLRLDTADDIANFGSFLDEAGDLVVSYGGSLSGEHGDGQLRANQLVKMFGPELVEAFGRFKRIWDPDGRMNPGKVVDAYQPDQNLAQGTDYRVRGLDTHFAFPDDRGGFADAVNRCFGIGKCRHHSGGTMCPSFMVTGEEEHSTRGRSRLLFEMMSGYRGMESGGGRDPWRDENVKQALDLCLACKGCKGDCPVGVDMATYKSEFLSHYYAGRLRPRAAYTLGFIAVWARLAAHAPRLANAALHAPVLARVGKALAGVAAERNAPRFATRTFRDWFTEHPPAGSGTPVLLWTDTFTNHFTPQVAIDAVRVLEAAGYAVRIPERSLCCGRPLYDYGMLPTATRWLRRILAELAQPLAEGVPVVVLEPSCLAVFRDELVNLLPADTDARRLAAASHSLAELLEATHGYRPPTLSGSALVQYHCHQQAVVGTGADERLAAATGLDVTRPDSGCCGMAGSFGYESGEHYRVSQAAAERVIAPRVRAADDDTVLLADGFSCRTQIEQATGRTPRHLAELLARGLPGVADPRPRRHRWRVAALGALATGLAGTVAVAVACRRRR